jgi:hypothetical protein
VYIAAMRQRLIAACIVAAMLPCISIKAEDITTRVRKAVERNTLDQPGTKPFHLKAVLAPSFERDKSSGRSGEVEIWWFSPDNWHREVRSPEFHQIEIVHDGKVWQKNDGDYFPEWLRETAVALIKPVPDLDRTLRYVKTGEEKTLPGEMTHISWVEMGSDGTASKGIGAGISLGAHGVTFASGIGYDAGLSELTDFHGRSVARKVTSGGGGAEVTARITVLEDLRDSPSGILDPGANPSDPILETAVVDEVALRKNLLPQEAAGWPTLEQGPLEGVLLAEVVIDREGKVRDMGSLLSDNPGLSDAARGRIGRMRFKPYLVNGLPAQAVTTITMPFKTSRPAGVESFESARAYFERGRKADFPAAASQQPYILRAEFKTRGSSGAVETGTYTDTWLSDSQWRREAVVGNSRVIRTRNGEKRYMIAEGPEVPLLRLVLIDMEPIPAIDTFVESDWRIKRDAVDGVAAIRVARGYENPDGTPDLKQFNAYWFDDSGRLLKTFSNGLEMRHRDFQSYNDVSVPRRIDVLNGGKLGMQMSVTNLEAAGTVSPAIFVLKGHEWVRQFTAEVR